MDIEATNVQAANAAPAIVDPQASNKEDPDITKDRKAPESDSVEISSEAISANAVQNPAAVTDDASDQENSGANLGQTAQPEVSPLTSENSVEQNAKEETPKAGLSAPQTTNISKLEKLNGVHEDLQNLREATKANFDARRTTKYTVQDGKVSVKVQSGDKEIEIPPEEVINTKSNLRQRLKAFVDASNIDINA